MLKYTGVQLTTDKIKEMLVQENKILNVFKPANGSDDKSEVMLVKGNKKKDKEKNHNNPPANSHNQTDNKNNNPENTEKSGK